MSWGLLKWVISAIEDNTQSQKPTEIGTETLDTETACGIMAISQTTGHGIHSPSLLFQSK